MFLKNFLYAESWNVAFRKGHPGKILEDTKSTFTIIKNNFRYWAADPFVVETKEKTYVFAELYDYILRRGVLGYCIINNGGASKWKPILKEKYHLSYPCFCKEGEKICIMPESGAGDVLSIYVLNELPDKIGERCILKKDVKYADTTPIPCGEKKLALTHRVEDPENPELVLIDLSCEDKEEIAVVKKGLRSRPGGHFFYFNGKLIRPSQISENTGQGYGKGLVFCECSLIENNQYNEIEIKEMYPHELTFNDNILLDGMHTYNSSPHYEVIDIKTRRFNMLNFVMRIIGKFLNKCKK